MKKTLLTYYGVTILFFALITLYKRWFDSPWYLMFWLGGAVGTLLPDLDGFIYALYLRPQELTSQRVRTYLAQYQFAAAYNLINLTRAERTKSIFHTALFQLVFLVFAFFIITSSGSLFGRGLVVAFMLHLLVDQAVDIKQTSSLSSWFQDFPLRLTQVQLSFYWVIILILTVFLGLFF